MCTNEQLQDLLQIFHNNMKALFGNKLKQVILFGSYARGDYDNESDVDIMVMVDMEKKELCQYYKEVSRITANTDLGFNVVISPMIKSYSEYIKYKGVTPFLQNIEREGVIIHA